MADAPDRPLVSVLMPVYNGESYLHISIESILNQRFTDFEFVIVDDGSTDSTAQILSVYAEQDARIRRISHVENIGLVRSLNKGLAQCRGHYIARQDADDIAKPDRLEKQLAYLEAHPDIGVLGTWREVIDEQGRFIQMETFPETHHLICWDLCFRCSLGHSTVVMKRNLLTQVGGYNENLPFGEDNDLWSRLSRETKLANLTEVLSSYRKSTHQISTRYIQKQMEAIFQIMQAHITHLMGQPVSGEIVRGLHPLTWSQPRQDKTSVHQTADLIRRLFQRYQQTTALTDYEQRQIRSDIAHRMFGLSLSIRHLSIWYAARLYGAALWWAPRFYAKTTVAILLRQIRQILTGNRW